MSDKNYPTIIYWDRITGEPVVANPVNAYNYISQVFAGYKYDETKGVWGDNANNTSGNKELRYYAHMYKNDTKRHWQVERCEHPTEVKLLLLLTQ